MNRAQRGGQAAVEFALTLPVLAMVLVAVLEWGRYLTDASSAGQAIRDAACAGARVRPTDDPSAVADERALEALKDAGLDSESATVTVVLGEVTAGPTIKVSASLPFVPLSGLVPLPATISASTTMRMEAR